jgi:hypothetical protein
MLLSARIFKVQVRSSLAPAAPGHVAQAAIGKYNPAALRITRRRADKRPDCAASLKNRRAIERHLNVPRGTPPYDRGSRDVRSSCRLQPASALNANGREHSNSLTSNLARTPQFSKSNFSDAASRSYGALTLDRAATTRARPARSRHGSSSGASPAPARRPDTASAWVWPISNRANPPGRKALRRPGAMRR